MKRLLAPVALLAVLAIPTLATGLITIPTGTMVSDERIYSVADVQTGLQRSPHAWAGRTVLVRGVAPVTMWAASTPAPARANGFSTQPAPGDPWYPVRGARAYIQVMPPAATPVSGAGVFATSAPPSLWVVSALPARRHEPVVDVLRRLPFVGALVPGADLSSVLSRSSHVATTFRVTLLASRPASCAPPACADAVVVGVVS